jgi:hypothetical protein
MESAMRIAFTGLLIFHGLIHLMGFAKAFGFAELPQLTQPISRVAGVVWLAAGLVMIASAFTPVRWFWLIGAIAVVLSSVVIFTAWHDAKFGLVANVIVLLGVVYAFASQGPVSLAAAYRRDIAGILTSSAAPPIVTDADLQSLPAPVARYLRVTGSVGQPRIVNFRAHWIGRIRSSATDPWMSFRAEQVNTLGRVPARVFSMNAIMRGLPVDVYHRFIAESASFRVRVLSLFTMVDAKGAVMDQSETVTILNDLCILAPAALIDPALRWESSDANSARVVFSRGAHIVRATLHFNGKGELVDFVSDDRSRASADGKTFTAERWSTPLSEYRTFGARHLGTRGKALTHARQGTFAYGEFELQSIDYNVSALAQDATGLMLFSLANPASRRSP